MALKVKKDGERMATVTIPRGSSTVTGETESGSVPENVHIVINRTFYLFLSHWIDLG